jgi:hypothetical protein
LDIIYYSGSPIVIEHSLLLSFLERVSQMLDKYFPE